jgi:hypothetical protein
MNPALRTSARSRPGKAPYLRRSGFGRAPGIGSWRRAGLCLGLLLALAVLPAPCSRSGAHAQESPDSSVLESATIPAAANWVVLEVTGIAAWRAQGESRWRAFEPGEVLPPGCEIETGPDGEVTLVAGGDQLTVAPNGRLLVPQAEPGQDRRLRHERGHILMHIESRNGRDVRINTPLLSLGIKGTVLESEVDAEQNSVVVHEGEVDVTTPDGRDPVALGAGEGLRQPAAPGAPAERFTLPEDARGTAHGQGWLRSPAGIGTPAPQGQGSTGAGTEAATAGAPARAVDSGQGGSDRARAPSARAEKRLGWLDELASSWAYVAIAGVALAILTIPVLVLLHNLREQWRGGKTEAAGRRRRELVRG